MLVLAIETSGASGSVALLNNEQRWSRQIPGWQIARQLAAEIAELARDADVSLKEVDAIAATTGPGSFTGLRIGIVTAKTLAYTIGRPCVGISTLDVLAFQTSTAAVAEGTRLWAILDAQRQQLFAARYELRQGVWQSIQSTSLMDQAAWLADWQPSDIVTGTGIRNLGDKLTPDQTTDLATWPPRALSVGELAIPNLKAGESVQPFALLPQYYRLSAAEEKSRPRLPAV